MQWWFAPVPIAAVGTVRVMLGMLSILYFIDANLDASFWFGTNGIHSASTVAEFLTASGLEDSASASISPLFLTDAFWVYRVYCLVAIGLAIAMMLGVGGRFVCFSLWLAIAFWANRLLWLAGWTETVLSLALFASCFAPTQRLSFQRRKTASRTEHVLSQMTGFSLRLFAVQTTIVAIVTWMSTLRGTAWWNGTGAVALAAPEDNRLFKMVDILRSPLLHEPLSLFIVLSIPLGLWLAWSRVDEPTTKRTGVVILIAWSLLVATLGSHWIYGGVMATGFLAIGQLRSTHTTKND